jgi:hypothetical protein
VNSVSRMDTRASNLQLTFKNFSTYLFITANLQVLVSLFYSTTLSVGTLIQRRWRMNKRYRWNDTYRRQAEYLQKSFSQCHFVSRKYQTDWSGIKRRNIVFSAVTIWPNLAHLWPTICIYIMNNITYHEWKSGPSDARLTVIGSALVMNVRTGPT